MPKVMPKPLEVRGPRGPSSFTMERPPQPRDLMRERWRGASVTATRRAQRPAAPTLAPKPSPASGLSLRARVAQRRAARVAVRAARVAERAATTAARAARLAETGAVMRTVLGTGRVIGTGFKIAGKTLKWGGRLEAAAEVGKTAYEGYKGKQAYEQLGRTIRGAAKYGVTTKRKKFLPGLLTGEPGVEVYVGGRRIDQE